MRAKRNLIASETDEFTTAVTTTVSMVIFGGINDCLNHFKKINDNSFDSKFDTILVNQTGTHIPKIRNLNIFRNDLIKELLFMLSCDKFWNHFKKHLPIYRSILRRRVEQESADSDIRLLNKFIDNQSDNSYGERSMVLRAIFFLMGVNPYHDLSINEPLMIRQKIKYEIFLLLSQFQFLVEISRIDSGKILESADYFDGYSSNYSQCVKLLHETILCVDSIFRFHTECFESTPSNLILPTNLIHEKDLIRIWGKSERAFRNEINRRKKDGEEIIRYIAIEDMSDEEKKVFVSSARSKGIETSSATQWLNTKMINTAFVEHLKDRDYNYPDIEEILLDSNLSKKSANIKIYEYLEYIQPSDKKYFIGKTSDTSLSFIEVSLLEIIKKRKIIQSFSTQIRESAFKSGRPLDKKFLEEWLKYWNLDDFYPSFIKEKLRVLLNSQFDETSLDISDGALIRKVTLQSAQLVLEGVNFKPIQTISSFLHCFRPELIIPYDPNVLEALEQHFDCLFPKDYDSYYEAFYEVKEEDEFQIEVLLEETSEDWARFLEKEYLHNAILFDKLKTLGRLKTLVSEKDEKVLVS